MCDTAYPDFAASHSYAKALGLKPTIETVKRIEVERTVDPRPQKKQKIVDEYEIDLFGSDEEVDYGSDILEAGPSKTST